MMIICPVHYWPIPPYDCPTCRIPQALPKSVEDVERVCAWLEVARTEIELVRAVDRGAEAHIRQKRRLAKTRRGVSFTAFPCRPA